MTGFELTDMKSRRRFLGWIGSLFLALFSDASIADSGELVELVKIDTSLPFDIS